MYALKLSVINHQQLTICEKMAAKESVIKILEEIAILLELTGENPFKSSAYQNAARNLEKLDTALN